MTLLLEWGWLYLLIDNFFCLSSLGVWYIIGCEVILYWLFFCLVLSLIFFLCWLITLFFERKFFELNFSDWIELEVLVFLCGCCFKFRLFFLLLFCVGENWFFWIFVCGFSRWSFVFGFDDLLFLIGLLIYRFSGGFCEKKSYLDSEFIWIGKVLLI